MVLFDMKIDLFLSNFFSRKLKKKKISKNSKNFRFFIVDSQSPKISQPKKKIEKKIKKNFEKKLKKKN